MSIIFSLKIFIFFSTPKRTLKEAIKDADVFLGVSVGNIVTPEMLLSMNRDPLVFALANPIPEIKYSLASNFIF